MIKELAIRFFEAFSSPKHIEIEDPIPLEQKTKGWNIRLSSQTLMEKVKNAEKIKPAVMQESAEHLKLNDKLMEGFLSIPRRVDLWSNFDRVDSPDKKWRVKE